MAVFLPAALRARQETPLSAAERFKRRMELIAPRATGAGRWIVVPQSYDRLARSSFRRGQRRRRNILTVILGAAAFSGLLAIVAGGAFVEMHVGLDASLAVYVVLLLDAKKRRLERATKVRSIAPERADREELTFIKEELQAYADLRR